MFQSKADKRETLEAEHQPSLQNVYTVIESIEGDPCAAVLYSTETKFIHAFITRMDDSELRHRLMREAEQCDIKRTVPCIHEKYLKHGNLEN